MDTPRVLHQLSPETITVDFSSGVYADGNVLATATPRRNCADDPFRECRGRCT
jgi:hypothetical protein